MKKKNFTYLLIFTIAAFTSCSDTKECPEKDPPNETDSYLFEVSIPEVTRAGWDGLGMVWQEDDQIGIYVNSDRNKPFAYRPDGSKAFFTGELSASIPQGATYYAYYPYGDSQMTGTRLTFSFPDVQTLPKDGLGYTGLPMIGKYVGDKEDVLLRMENVYTLLRIPLILSGDESDEVRVLGIKVEAQGGEFIAGDLTVDMDGDFFSPDFSSLDKNTVTLNAEADGGVALSRVTATDFYLAVAPVRLTEGVKITVVTSGYSIDFYINDTIDFERNTVYSFDELRTGVPMIIPDPDFRAVLEEWGVIEVIDPTSGIVKITEAGKTANSFNFAGYGFRDITGIEYFTTLTELGCEAVGISKLDVSKNVNLRLLYCRNNYLTSLDISQNTKLEELDCAENDIETLDVTANTKLNYLRFETNRISDIDLSTLADLNDIIAYENEIRELDFSRNPKLVSLDLSQNPLRRVDVSNNPLMLRVDICDTPIEEVDISNCKDLIALCFKTIPGAGWGGVEYVNSLAFDDTLDLSEAPSTLKRFVCDNIDGYSYEWEGHYYWSWRNLICDGNSSIEYLSFRNCSGMESVTVKNVPSLQTLDITGTTASDDRIDVDNTFTLIK